MSIAYQTGRIFIVFSIALLCGCASYGPWHDMEPIEISGEHRFPWCEANQTLKAQGRTINSPFATTSETRYLACGNGTFDLPEEVHAIESRLVNSPIAEDWKRNIFGKIETPFDVVLVSVRPTVLILCEREEHGKSHRYPEAFDSKVLERGIGYGPVVLCKRPTSWLDERFENQTLESNSSTTKVAKFEGGSIELTWVNGVWRAKRK